MEYLVISILRLKDDISGTDLAKLQTHLMNSIEGDIERLIWPGEEGKPLVFWSFNPLDPPFPIGWRE